MLSRRLILERIRQSKRVVYDKLEPRREIVTPGIHEPGPEAKTKRVAWLQSRINAKARPPQMPESEHVDWNGHDLLFDYYTRRIRDSDPSRKLFHVSGYFDQNGLDQPFVKHLRENGIEMPKYVGSSHAATGYAIKQAGEEGTLRHMADFIDHYNLVGKMKQHIDQIPQEPGEFE